MQLETVARALVGYIDYTDRNLRSIDLEILHTYINMLRETLPAVESETIDEHD